jgi:hypothetical protein
MRPAPSKKRIVIAMILPAVVLVSISLGIGYLHYRRIVTPIPEFESLRPIPADGM